MHYLLKDSSNSLEIGNKEKSFSLKLHDSENLTRWINTLNKLGIHQKIQLLPLEEKQNITPQSQILAAPVEEVGSFSDKRDLYAAPETFKFSMEHFLINANLITKMACRDTFSSLNWRGLERIPEEQECCE